ncbi:hypothetical protein [uncultured Croceitalea sp.]|uniref:hypothetical protein n=1 Tax=uncultured Croceitalea sp. TaxID=1798908 RepID=UPI003305F581
MRKSIATVVATVSIFLFFGCDIESDENFQFVTLEVISADMPEVFTQNAIHQIEVTYRRADDCTFFYDFDVSSNEANRRDIVAIGSYLTKDTCSETDDEVKAILRFQPLETFTYHFRFYTGSNENDEPQYVEYMVPVEPKEVN